MDISSVSTANSGNGFAVRTQVKQQDQLEAVTNILLEGIKQTPTPPEVNVSEITGKGKLVDVLA